MLFLREYNNEVGWSVARFLEVCDGEVLPKLGHGDGTAGVQLVARRRLVAPEQLTHVGCRLVLVGCICHNPRAEVGQGERWRG